jgi:hypothetical protein
VYTKHRLGTSKRQSQPLFCTYWWRYTRYTKHMLGTSKQRWVPRKGSPNLCFVHTGGGTHDTQNTCWAPRNSVGYLEKAVPTSVLYILVAVHMIHKTHVGHLETAGRTSVSYLLVAGHTIHKTHVGHVEWGVTTCGLLRLACVGGVQYINANHPIACASVQNTPSQLVVWWGVREHMVCTRPRCCAEPRFPYTPYDHTAGFTRMVDDSAEGLRDLIHAFTEYGGYDNAQPMYVMAQVLSTPLTYILTTCVLVTLKNTTQHTHCDRTDPLPSTADRGPPGAGESVCNLQRSRRYTPDEMDPRRHQIGTPLFRHHRRCTPLVAPSPSKLHRHHHQPTTTPHTNPLLPGPCRAKHSSTGSGSVRTAWA